MAQEERVLLVDRPAPWVQRLTLNRPDKRNALNNALRGAILDALQAGDRDPDIRVSILRGAGPCFSSGYDLGSNLFKDQPFVTAGGDGQWARHVLDGACMIWDLAKPVIGQVHGYCLAGGSELAAACDLVYVADDVQMGYPPVRLMSPPDNQFHPWFLHMRHAMEMMLTGDAYGADDLVRMGFANRAFARAELDDAVLAIAERIAKIPSDLQQLNKRSVHRAMEVMGMRAALRAGTEIQALAFHQPSSRAYRAQFAEKGVSASLSERDRAFGDYRTRAKPQGDAT
ncbi:enoyl-CoA hydratase/isomerase family protein [Zavarzinia sp. CC-PAN008]|uniref:enoyl-CoA hydratase/isomerase family protein n=1 Tax=Zavarzinia sp. CC-PAN008 TaxID=3243332 RepID=UPI003F74785F